MLAKYPLKYAFFLALVALLFFPPWPLYFLAPYLIVAIYRKTKFYTLLHAMGAGILIDLLSQGDLFGLTALTYCTVVFILYPQKRNFFEDKLSTLPLMSALFAFLTGLVSLGFSALFTTPPPVHLFPFLFDLVVMPLFDALYALIYFALPFQFYLVAFRLLKRRKAHASFRKRARS